MMTLSLNPLRGERRAATVKLALAEKVCEVSTPLAGDGALRRVGQRMKTCKIGGVSTPFAGNVALRPVHWATTEDGSA